MKKVKVTGQLKRHNLGTKRHREFRLVSKCSEHDQLQLFYLTLVCLSVCLSVRLLSICPVVCLSVCLSVCSIHFVLSIVRLSVCLSVCVFSSVCLFVYLCALIIFSSSQTLSQVSVYCSFAENTCLFALQKSQFLPNLHQIAPEMSLGKQ